MLSLTAANWVLVVAMVVFTAVAAAWDLREKRIPNKLTLPMFFAGWIYQIAFHGWAGVLDGLAGFAIGFGVLFVLWFIGGGGGGDVKLMGAMSVWMGFQMTLLVLVTSTAAVVLLTMGAVVWGILNRGMRKTQERLKAKAGETRAQKQARRILPYAVPVALATWLVLAWKIPGLNKAARAAEKPVEKAAPAQPAEVQK
ncbi:Type IV leader peptidase family protein [Caulifigura coniformis]|uniref:Type IV leader peptidase family protein n=1 Tax=Caulifigura coniformis TaxID=2527983 RepID=A0A517SJ42_9PLAN|nr:A24 family peptidase [Caulifigura coniformis]QDT56150.1 Type IV leader peptidase family protein [Caulifigura coniformis]